MSSGQQPIQIIYGGSFNPPHLGHGWVIAKLEEFFPTAKIWLVPSGTHPWGKEVLHSQDERLLLLKNFLADLQAEGIGRSCQISTWEWQQTTTTYTYYTLKHFQSSWPTLQTALAIGEDHWRMFTSWHQYQRILAEFPIIVLPRLRSTTAAEALNQPVSQSNTILLTGSKIRDYSPGTTLSVGAWRLPVTEFHPATASEIRQYLDHLPEKIEHPWLSSRVANSLSKSLPSSRM